MIIVFDNQQQYQDAIKLGQHFNVPVKSAEDLKEEEVNKHPQDLLFFTDGHLEFRHKDKGLGSLWVNFNSDIINYRIQHGGRKKEAIGRAVGLKKNKSPILFDLTAGLGRDSYILANLGCKVHLFERNKVLSALLDDGLLRAKKENNNQIADNMALHSGDAINCLPEIAKKISPDVIYMDPMFPHRTKSALVKKEMRLIRSLVGPDKDSDILFDKALNFAQERVVCKRPKQAPPLGDKEADMSIETKKHRFDVYFTRLKGQKIKG